LIALYALERSYLTMEQPDFDDLINDYVEDDYEEPTDYDEGMMEEMMGEEPEPQQGQGQEQQQQQQETNKSLSQQQQQQQLSTNQPSQPMREEPVQTPEVEDENGVHVRDYIARQNEDNQLYSFER
jgi:hypothetical protein